MKTSVALLWAALAALTFLSSCSIKEDRSPCPCYLNVNLDRMCDTGSANAVVCVQSESFDSVEEIQLKRYSGSGYELAVPRNTVRVSVLSGIAEGSVCGDDVAFMSGFETDALWAWTQTVQCNGDDMTLHAEPHKLFCNVNLIMTGLVPDVEYDYDMVIRAGCNAVDVHDFSPVAGKYEALMTRHEGIVYSVRLPRQGGNEVLIDFYESERKVHELDLNSELAAIDYDWEKEDLDDIYVTVDFSLMSVEVSIVEWDKKSIYQEI